jgi:lipid-binding SYLF domain-containing protein
VDVSLRNIAAFFTYSITRGLFAGMSLEGTILVERKGANRK